MRTFGAVVLALLIFTAVMVTALNFSPPEHLVRQFAVEKGWMKS